MREITRQEYLTLREGAAVTSADEHGDKVLLLTDGTYLKLFRVKRLITSARIFPYWRRFVRNAERLQQLDIPTLQVIEVLRIPEIDRTAVHYEPLPGSSVRDLDGGIDAPLAERLGRFIKTLHDKGVYLRSMHLGNVVATPEGELGLIDIADMRIRSRSLSNHLRIRNFRHLCRYEDDRSAIATHLEDFVGAFDERFQVKLRELFNPRPE